MTFNSGDMAFVPGDRLKASPYRGAHYMWQKLPSSPDSVTTAADIPGSSTHFVTSLAVRQALADYVRLQYNLTR